jgi:hypothetical protein
MEARTERLLRRLAAAGAAVALVGLAAGQSLATRTPGTSGSTTSTGVSRIAMLRAELMGADPDEATDLAAALGLDEDSEGAEAPDADAESPEPEATDPEDAHRHEVDEAVEDDQGENDDADANEDDGEMEDADHDGADEHDGDHAESDGHESDAGEHEGGDGPDD